MPHRASTSALLMVALTTTVLLLLSSSSSPFAVHAMFKVPDLDKDKRCPACVSFAVALRKASWESHPPFEGVDKKTRKKFLNSDSRCQELLTEAMDVVLTRQAFVYFVPGSVPPTDRDEPWQSDANDHIILYFNKTDAPSNAIGRFWSLQDLYLHRRLRVADFQRIAQVLERNTDQSLMHFMHDELRESLGEETEALCYLDLFQSSSGKNKKTKEELVNEPIGLPGLKDFSQSGKAFDLEAEWLMFNVLKNRTQDELEALEWAYKLCKAKELCGRDAEKSTSVKKSKSNKKKQAIKSFIHSMFPIHPPKTEAKDFSNDPEKASGVFEAPQDKPLGKPVDPAEMQEMYEQQQATRKIESDDIVMPDSRKTIRIDGPGGDETPLMLDEEY